MKRFFIATALALVLASSCAAQDHSMEQLLSAREALIKRYVLSTKLAARVAICGHEDLLTGEVQSYITVYVYRASMKAFLDDYVNFATETSPGGSLGVGGIPVSVDVIDPAGRTPDEQPKQKQQPKPDVRPDNRTDFPTRKT